MRDCCMLHAALRSRHPLALPAGTLCSVADGSELIGSPRTNCATKAEQVGAGATAAGGGGGAAGEGCCRLLSSSALSPAADDMLSSAAPAFVCPSAASVTTRLASVATHTETHTPKMGHLNVSRFPETNAMPFNLLLSLLHASVCSPSCVMDARHHFLCTMRDGAWQQCTKRKSAEEQLVAL